MLNNPDLIASLIGFDGLLAIALTAVITRLLSDEGRAARLEAAKDSIADKVNAVAETVGYVQGTLDNFVSIVADGSVTPDEVKSITDEVAEIKSKITGIVSGGDDAA